MFEKPMVGARLGNALIALLHRMDDFRPDKEENEDDLLAYLDSQGYTDFRECPDHALSVLQYAEVFQYRDLWIDAFAHCVGMYDTLSLSAEFEVQHPNMNFGTTIKLTCDEEYLPYYEGTDHELEFRDGSPA